MSDFARVVRKQNWLSPFRVEYDGKYITLFGKDKNYPIQDYWNTRNEIIDYEEMVLVPVVAEVRGAEPQFIVFDDCIIINFNCSPNA